MFMMAILGNLTYGISLLLRPLSMDYFVSKLPWLVTLSFFFPPRALLFHHALCRWEACACVSLTFAFSSSSSSMVQRSLCLFKPPINKFFQIAIWMK